MCLEPKWLRISPLSLFLSLLLSLSLSLSFSLALSLALSLSLSLFLCSLSLSLSLCLSFFLSSRCLSILFVSGLVTPHPYDLSFWPLFPNYIVIFRRFWPIDNKQHQTNVSKMM